MEDDDQSATGSSSSSSSYASGVESDFSDSGKNVLLYSIEAMKKYIAINRVFGRHNSPLLDVGECIKSLDLERVHLFGQALRENVDIRSVEVCVDTSTFDNQFAKDLAVFLGKCPSLTSIDLSVGSSIASATEMKLVRLFLHAFLHNPNAHHKQISIWGIETNPPSGVFPDVAKSTSMCRTLESIKCCDCSINIATSLLQGIILQKSARHVEYALDWPATDETNRMLQLLVENVCTLHTLRLDTIPFQAIEHMLSGFSQLRELTCLELVLQPVENCGDRVKALEFVTNVMMKSQSIKKLILHNFVWDTETEQTKVIPNSTLESLVLSGGSSLRLSRILRICPALRSLDLEGLTFSRQGDLDMVNLTKLDSCLQEIKFPLLSDDQVADFFDGLQQVASVRSLRFAAKTLSTETKEKITRHLQMKHGDSLLHLSIHGASGELVLMDELSAVLPEDRCSLISLHLVGIPAPAVTIGRFFASLRSNTRLQNLSIMKSGVDTDGSLHVCEHLPFLTHLTSLRLDIPVVFEEDHEDTFVKAMESNESLTKLSFDLEDSRLESIGEFFTTRNRNKWMFAQKSRRSLWPYIIWKYDDSALFQWVYELSNHSYSLSGKRKAVHAPIL